MAIYTYRCPHCSRSAEVVQSIKSYCEKPEVPVCPSCMWKDKPDHRVFMERYLTPTLVSFDTAPWAAYQSPIDGEVIDSRAKRNEHMAKHGVVPFDEIKPDFERKRKEVAEAHRKGLKQDIVEATTRVLDAGYKPQVESAEHIVPAE